MEQNGLELVGAKVNSIVFDCDNPEKLAAFYRALLGGTVQVDPYGGHYLTVPGLDIGLGFQLDEDYERPVWLGDPKAQQIMLHLDIQVKDRQKAIDYALSIGAEMPSAQFCQPDWEVQWTTLLDPAGHPFCLFETA